MRADGSRTSALILVAKYPAPHRSKTRLAAAIGGEHAGAFARAALLDLLQRFARPFPLGAGGEGAGGGEEERGDGGLEVRRVVLFAPREREEDFRSLIGEIGPDAAARWTLEAMEGSSLTGHSPGEGSELGDFLRRAVERHREEGGVVFIGSDCLSLPSEAVALALTRPPEEAFIVPATDGGYVMLGLPPQAALSVFDNVVWSSTETCASQEVALRAANLSVRRWGEAESDVDEAADLAQLATRFALLPVLAADAPRVAALFADRGFKDALEAQGV